MEQPIVSVVHATRGANRWAWIWRAYDWCLQRATRPDEIEYIFVLDADDTDLINKMKPAIETGSRLRCPTRLIIGPAGQGNNGAWNLGAHKSVGKMLLQLSDDFECPAAWDARCRVYFERAGGLDKKLVLGVGDPHFSGAYSGDGLLTILVCTRPWLATNGGCLLYPEYPSVFSDTEIAQKAALDDCLIDAYDEIYFYHHWYGGTEDPQRDDTYSRHMTTECNDTGRQVFGERHWSAFPDIYPYRYDPDRDMLTDEEGLAPPEPVGPRTGLLAYRKQRGTCWVKNVPFEPNDPRAAWIKGDFKTARDGMVELMAKYHLKACGGRFLFHAAHHIWYYASQALGDRELVGVREVHR